MFEPEFLRKLENMAFLVKKARAGRYSGQHRSPRKGQSVEFADYRAYTAGDDWRQVDWHAYARLERLFIKLFMEENDLLIYLLVDTSASMGWKEGRKLKLAKEIAGALGYLALVNSEQAGAASLDRGMARFLPAQRGRGGISRLWGFLQELEAGEDTDLNTALMRTGKFIKGPGITILISDMLSPGGYTEGLKYLQHLGQQVVVLQILEPEEREPDLLGNFELVDCETNTVKEVSVTPLLLQAYRKRTEEFLHGLSQFCAAREITYHLISSEEELEEIILRSLRTLAVLT